MDFRFLNRPILPLSAVLFISAVTVFKRSLRDIEVMNVTRESAGAFGGEI